MKKLLALCLLVTLASCKEETGRKPVGESTVTTGERSCSIPGFCFRLTMNRKGGVSYGYGYSNCCSGKQTATVKKTIYKIIYSDGSTERLPHSETISETPCKQ